MAEPHTCTYVYPTLRLLTFTQPDGCARIYVERWCRYCGKGESVTGSGRRSSDAAALPHMETFWETVREKEN